MNNIIEYNFDKLYILYKIGASISTDRMLHCTKCYIS